MKKIDLSDKTIDLTQTPKGNNENNSLSSYYQRKLYEIVAFNQRILSNNKPINILYDKQFYGRVNLNHESVIVDISALKTSSSNSGNRIKLQNFVIDAYRDFMYTWNSYKKVNKLSTDSNFYNISAVKSWSDPINLYFYWMSAIFDQFRDYINLNKLKIKNFDIFFNEFISFVDSIVPNIPILFSSFISSKMADPLISGLCFDVKNLDLTDDNVKYSGAMQDQNYAIFKKTAMKFGFFPDKQIPWRLYADIDSPAMLPYMQKYNLTQDNLYDKNFFYADSYDLEYLRFYVLNFYNTFISQNKSIKEPQFKICEKTGATIVDYKLHNLSMIKPKDISSDLQYDRMFMKLYVFIKARENNYSWNQSYFDGIVYNFIQIKEALDIRGAMKYIRPLVKLPAISDEKQRNFRFV